MGDINALQSIGTTINSNYSNLLNSNSNNYHTTNTTSIPNIVQFSRININSK